MSENDVFTEPGGDDSPEQPAVEVSTAPEPVAEVPAEPVAEPVKSPEEKYNELLIALRQERASSRETKAEIETLRQQVEQFKALREELDARRKETQAAKERALFEENPAEYLRQQTERLSQKIEGLSAQEAEAVKKFEAQQALDNTVRMQATSFAKENADYIDAFQFVRDRKFAEYELYGVPPEQREQAFHQESMAFAQHAVANGRNAAEMVYNLAKTWGYAPKQVAVPAQTAEAKVAALQNGQKAAQTLSTGTAPPRESMLARVEDMSDDEFDKFWKEEISPRRRA